jgi:hypothetical protein
MFILSVKLKIVTLDKEMHRQAFLVARAIRNLWDDQ